MPKRSLTYWRARWLGGEVPNYRTLEAVVRALLEAFPTTNTTAVVRGDGSVVEERHRRLADRQPILLHCAAYMPGAEGSVVPRAADSTATAPLQAIRPPDGADFLTGAIMALIADDHCLLCSEGLTSGALRYYLQQLIIRRGLPQPAQRLDFEAVANRDRLQEIMRSGVREIGLSTTLDELDMSSGSRDTLIGKIRAEFGEAVMTVLGKEESVDDLSSTDYANINARLIVSLNGRRTGVVTQEQFDDAARHAIDEDDPGVYVRLRTGARIDHQSIKLTKKVDLLPSGSTIDHNDAWLKLEEFYSELISSGYVSTVNAN